MGPLEIDPPVVLSPMAGVTDKPFRALCRMHGAGYAVSEMLTSNQDLWKSRKSTQRMDHTGERAPIGVQIAGADPQEMAAAARENVNIGAQIIDINMGCPAKKVCRRWSGSALLQDEQLVARILNAVVQAVDVPVTLKIRTGWHREHVNGVEIARIAEGCGVQMLAVHGRTRDMLYKGDAEYETIARIKGAVDIPVLANGDIDSPEKALKVFRATSADGVMIGRGAQGNPWIFSQISNYLRTGSYARPSVIRVRDTMLQHAADIHESYGQVAGVRIARKHLAWYAENLGDTRAFRRAVLREPSPELQLQLARDYFDRWLDEASSTTSIQCLTGTAAELARCS